MEASLSRSSGSPRSRSSDSPRLRGKDSPRLKARDSPRCKVKKNRSKGAESPRRRGARSPATHVTSTDSAQGSDSVHSPRLKESSHVHGSDPTRSSQLDSPRLDSPPPSQDQKDSPSCSPSLPKSPPQPAPTSCLEDVEVERRRAEAERLLEEAVSSWKEAQEVLQEVKELQSQTLRRQRRRTYEKMTPAAAALLSATSATEEDDTPASPEEDEESETP